MVTDDQEERREQVVFWVRRDTQCSDCGDELHSGSAIILENGAPMCLECAGLDHLEYLRRGDAALTRRSRKHSSVSLPVVEWSRARKQYERQGILAEPEAIAKAEEECLADADVRERQRQRRRQQEGRLDSEHVEAFARRIKELWPGCPDAEARRIAEHACRRHSGRVGRTAAAKGLDEEAVDLAVRAAIRHRHTRYGQLLAQGWFRDEARREVKQEMYEVEAKWRDMA